MRAVLLLVALVLPLAGCAMPAAPVVAPGTPVDLALVQLYAESARIRVLSGTAPLDGVDPFRAPAERTTGIGAHELTIRWSDGSTKTLTDLAFARGPDVYFEAEIARTGFTECSFRAVVLDGTSNASREFSQCGIQREHLVGIGELALGDGRGSVTLRVWRAPVGRIADWGNGSVQHEPREMELVDGVAFSWWRVAIGDGRVVEGDEAPVVVAPGVYRLEFPADNTLEVGVNDLSFEATLPDGRRITNADVDIRLLAR